MLVLTKETLNEQQIGKNNDIDSSDDDKDDPFAEEMRLFMVETADPVTVEDPNPTTITFEQKCNSLKVKLQL